MKIKLVACTFRAPSGWVSEWVSNWWVQFSSVQCSEWCRVEWCKKVRSNYGGATSEWCCSTVGRVGD